MKWDAHFHNLTALVRFSGVGGILSRSTSPVLSAGATAKLTRTLTSKDLLTSAFRAPEIEPSKKKKSKKKPDNKKSGS